MKAWLLVEIETPTIVAETQAEAARLTHDHMERLAARAGRLMRLADKHERDARVLRYGWAEEARQGGAAAGDAWEAGRE